MRPFPGQCADRWISGRCGDWRRVELQWPSSGGFLSGLTVACEWRKSGWRTGCGRPEVVAGTAVKKIVPTCERDVATRMSAGAAAERSRARVHNRTCGCAHGRYSALHLRMVKEDV